MGGMHINQWKNSEKYNKSIDMYYYVSASTFFDSEPAGDTFYFYFITSINTFYVFGVFPW